MELDERQFSTLILMLNQDKVRVPFKVEEPCEIVILKEEGKVARNEDDEDKKER